ncbi:MAG: aspartate-semialdehyde dehydrogenase, partial [Bdellovibrionales bacterium]|nr:aspartate-semialdehyde dehydrogenase [Bdellovibrionales bacterium]
VRVPVFHSHAESVNIELESKLSRDELFQILENAPGVEVFPADDHYPMQIGAAGGDTVQVGRIRKDESVEHGFEMWLVSDNLRKGAALNAVQIAESLIESSTD